MRPICKHFKSCVTSLAYGKLRLELIQEKLERGRDTDFRVGFSINDQVEVCKFYGSSIGFTTRKQVDEKLCVLRIRHTHLCDRVHVLSD